MIVELTSRLFNFNPISPQIQKTVIGDILERGPGILKGYSVFWMEQYFGEELFPRNRVPFKKNGYSIQKTRERLKKGFYFYQ